jgi:hypothetical protein
LRTGTTAEIAGGASLFCDMWQASKGQSVPVQSGGNAHFFS